MEDEYELLTSKERKKKMDEQERKRAKKDIEGKKSSILTYKDKKSEKED